MYPITSAIEELFNRNERQMLRITGVDKNGTTIAITESSVMDGSFYIDRYSTTNTRLELGTAIAAECGFKLNNSAGAFDGIIFEGAELFVEVGIADNSGESTYDWTTDGGDNVVTEDDVNIGFFSPTINWIPCGYFTSMEQPRNRSIITVNALDRMVRFDREVDETDLTVPCTIKSLVEQACTICGVPLESSLVNLPNSGYVMQEIPKSNYVVTYRSLLQSAAQLMGVNAFVDWNGRLRLQWYSPASYVSTPDKRYSSDLYENDITVTGITCTDMETQTVYIAGAEGYTLDITGNMIAQVDDLQILLTAIYSAMAAFTYRPFEATVNPAPWLFPMDRIVFTGLDGVSHVSFLTNVNFGINCNTNIGSRGETEASNNFSSGGYTSEQMKAIDQLTRQFVTGNVLAEAIDDATRQITGAEDSHVRFMYDADGALTEILVMDTDDVSTAVNVWRWNSAGFGHSSNGVGGPYSLAMTQNGAIVANMITAGTMSANLIRGGTLELGGLNNANGILDILDANGNVVIHGDNDGIDINSGSINLGWNTTLNRYNFTVDSGGQLTAMDATIVGTVKSTSVNPLDDGVVQMSNAKIEGGTSLNNSGNLDYLYGTIQFDNFYSLGYTAGMTLSARTLHFETDYLLVTGGGGTTHRGWTGYINNVLFVNGIAVS